MASSSTVAYKYVSADWTQPAVKCGSGTTDVATWVGLDGYTSDSVEQVGTEAVCEGGSADYFAWYEVYPAYAVDLSQTVKAGDSISASVTATSGDKFTFKIEDVTQGWTQSIVKTDSSASLSSAEVVVEIPSEGTVQPKGGSVTFTDAQVNGGSLGSADPTMINSTDPNCGPLIDGTEFTCTWG